MEDLIKKDAPIEKIEDDCFERADFINHILRVIHYIHGEDTQTFKFWEESPSPIFNSVEMLI